MHCGNQTLLKNNSSISTTPTITPHRMLLLESIPSWCTKVFAFLQSQMLLGARFLSFPKLLVANRGSRDKDSKNRIMYNCPAAAVKAKLMISVENGQNRTSSSRITQISRDISVILWFYNQWVLVEVPMQLWLQSQSEIRRQGHLWSVEEGGRWGRGPSHGYSALQLPSTCHHCTSCLCAHNLKHKHKIQSATTNTQYKIQNKHKHRSRSESLMIVSLISISALK